MRSRAAAATSSPGSPGRRPRRGHPLSAARPRTSRHVSPRVMTEATTTSSPVSSRRCRPSRTPTRCCTTAAATALLTAQTTQAAQATQVGSGSSPEPPRPQSRDVTGKSPRGKEKPMSVPHYSLFIDGEWVDSPERYEVRSPATGELVATGAKGGTQHIDQAVAAAKAAHASGVWRTKAPEERADLLNAVAARLAARTDELAVLQTRENGATIRVTSILHLGLSIGQPQDLAEPAKSYEFEKSGPAIGPLPAEGILRREPPRVVAAIGTR